MPSLAAALLLVAVPEQPSAKPARPPVPPEQRIRCRSSIATGSLARSVRICRTVAEWRRLEDRDQADLRTVMDRSLSVPCGECRLQPGQKESF